MKKILLLLYCLSLFILSCQKSISIETHDNDVEDDSTIFTTGDTLTYEVISADTSGWFGIWTDASGNLVGTPLDSVTYGSPVYNKSGWKYSFAWDGYSSQLMMSVANRTYSEDITINLYRNNELIKTVTNNPNSAITNNPNDTLKGAARVIYNVDGAALEGTAHQPVLTYEVLVDEMDSTKYQYDAWNGCWYTSEGISTCAINSFSTLFAIPSGWKYSFTANHLPFEMSMQTFPYSKDGATITINFYVNGVLVKTNSSSELTYPPITYEVL